MIEIIDVQTSPAVIKVLGVGGGGSNAVARMIQAGLGGVEFWVANTDLQALEHSGCPNRLQIGRSTTRGLGAGGDPEVGRASAEEDRDAVAAAISGADMLFITAGMGGGTGTGAAPVVAEIAQQLGILTVAIVTKPFHFEGKKKMLRARAGIELLGGRVDTLIPIPNQKLLNIVEPGTPFAAAMLVADEVLFQATRGISDLITGHGMINLDFADVKSVMAGRGNALLGCGVGSGANRAREAAQNAVSSPLLEEVSILGAQALLINVQGGPDMGLHEAAEATQFIADRVGEEADVFWGAVVDPSLADELRVTIIATGFAPQPAGEAASARSVEAAPVPAVREELRRGEDTRPALASDPIVVESRPPLARDAGPQTGEPRRGPAGIPAVAWRAGAEPGPASERAGEAVAEPSPSPLVGALSGSAARSLAGDRFEPDYASLAPRSWERDGSLESEVFLPEREEEGSIEPAPVEWAPRESGRLDPARPAGAVEPAASRGRTDHWWDLDRLLPQSRRQQESHLGRSALDKPTFMRKRMD